MGERRSNMHSAKPEAFYDLVESVSPGPYLELFARRQRLGWDTWGNEALEHVDLGTSA
jgi:N6-adenosine-specific RNA methylase IME4